MVWKLPRSRLALLYRHPLPEVVRKQPRSLLSRPQMSCLRYATPPRGKEILFAALRQLEFLCQSGLYSPISTCYVCATELEKFLTEDMHVLQLESPNDTKWTFLKSLGVTLEPDIELFLDLLREQKKTISLTDDVENIADLLYEEMITFCMPSNNASASRAREYSLSSDRY